MKKRNIFSLFSLRKEKILYRILARFEQKKGEVRMSDEKRKREDLLIMEGSPCEYNFHPDGPRTLEEAEKMNNQICPNFETCRTNHSNGYKGQSCIMLLATCLARERLNGKTEKFKTLIDAINPPNGFVWSKDRKTFVVIADKKRARKLIDKFVDQLTGKS
jgi:hypothetical protein